MRGQWSRPVQQTSELRPKVVGGDRRAPHAPAAEALGHHQAAVACGGDRPLTGWLIPVPNRPAPFQPRTGDIPRSRDTSATPRPAPAHASLPHRPVLRFPLHLTARAECLSQAWCCAGAAGRRATDAAAAVLPRGRTRRRAVAPLSRSAAENATRPAFPDRTIASHRSTRVVAVVRGKWHAP